MNTEQHCYALHPFLPSCLVHSFSLHLLIKLSTQISQAVSFNNHDVTEASVLRVSCYEKICKELLGVEIKKNKSKCVNYSFSP